MNLFCVCSLLYQYYLDVPENHFCPIFCNCYTICIPFKLNNNKPFKF